MGSCSPQLPLICLSDQTLKPGSSKWVKVRSDVRKALEDYGCFEAKIDQVSMELQGSVLKAMQELFALPTEAKQRNVCPKPFTGYLSHNGLSESFGIKDANILEKAHEFTQQLWPEGNKSISKMIQLYAEKLAELDMMVRRLILESYGIEYFIDEHLNSTYYRMRLMKYIARPDNDITAAVGANVDNGANDNADGDANVNDDGASIGVKVNVDVGDDVNDNDSVNIGVGVDINVETNVNGDLDAEANGDATAWVVGAVSGNASVGAKEANVDAELGLPSHTDKSLTGIIYQHQIDGLEVKTKEGKWIRVKPAPNTVIVIAGDALCALMNGRIPSPYHRVRVTEKKKTRYAAALFSNPKEGYIIDSPKELVDEKHPRAFKPFDFVDLFNFYHTEAGRRAPSTLQAFCGVSAGK
ncbi:putative oxidoreductase [Arabidopsis thaliana]|uniref:2-oxoglutarate-dependent dioxygenase AOP3 n=2 Tax=Arabidopsis thaliana TaxID=3702 RepID=AOP3C_ARATH|nr:2-oxoglutarate-dependent dioxygenase [Arabidopsis thaliana]NP_001319855.1 2-oxoglutarate-dependent dioxygenase [Arabidopsis thaliana]Q9ZTA1.1 RecName: Full=2-oxoglutarate-dependent dioxygenase AOP3 [Arabidopsis thaliana]AAC79100.1 putative oxidoreductase [Arabidopsis thaliana]AEE82265.2 2-oxoglutarate-dependent dioxygenase [Arabidopsis thaliana]AEE82266.2 2-oxoglutarate-dependent dioxygenase [Arabidopsis thaliana]CAA0393385.1 unnamed protein product [Arabidopsis thaliana]CAB77790.1 putati|eukprot:NP_001319854.1 2-oxoglutarate-dependent dioxygenase [Arabidopsis thaliana]